MEMKSILNKYNIVDMQTMADIYTLIRTGGVVELNLMYRE